MSKDRKLKQYSVKIKNQVSVSKLHKIISPVIFTRE